MSTSSASDHAIRCFDLAWHQATVEYGKQRVNSEACLQALLYWCLRNELAWISEGFRIFVNCWVVLEGNKRVYFDTLVCFEKKVVLAVELKYRPNGRPKVEEILTDLRKLASFRSRSKFEGNLQILLRRFRNADTKQKIRMTVAPTRRLVFAAFVKESAFAKTAKEFWSQYGKICGNADWENRKAMPPRLGIRLAEAKPDGTATIYCFGGVKTEGLICAEAQAA